MDLKNSSRYNIIQIFKKMLMSETLNVTLVTFLGYIDGCWLYKGFYACPLKRYFFHAPNTLSFLKEHIHNIKLHMFSMAAEGNSNM